MPGTGAIRWGDISFRVRQRPPTEPPILTRRTRDQQTGGTGVMGTEGHGRGAGGRQHGQNKHTHLKPHPIGAHRVACGARPRCRRAAAGPGQTTSQRTEQHQRPGTTGVEGAGGTGGHGRGAGGRRQGQGGPRDRPLRAVRLACGDLAGGPPPTGAQSSPAQKHTRRPEHQRHSTSPATGKGNPYSPRNALIAGISRTACTRPAR